jgi:hypothetical protein
MLPLRERFLSTIIVFRRIIKKGKVEEIRLLK